MKHLFSLVAIAFLSGTISVYAQLDTKKPYSQRMVESLSLQTFNNNEHPTSLSNTNFGYVTGLVAKSMLETYGLYHVDSYYQVAKQYADSHLTDDAAAPLNIHDNDIDAINAGKIFFDLYRFSLEEGDGKSAEKYKAAATYMYDKLKNHHTRIQAPLPGAGCFIHKGRYPDQMWLDGLYMGAAFLAGYEATFGEGTKEDWADIALQFKTIHKYTWDSDVELNYHVWSANPTDENSFWAKRDEPYKGCSPNFWARGEGWYFAALVDVLAVMPKNHPDYPDLLEIFRQVAKGVAKWQDKSGCWYQLLQYDDQVTGDGKGDTINGKVYNVGTQANYLESSASSMFTYAYCKGISLGLLPKSYIKVARKAFKGILENFITENPDGSINILQSCASCGLGPAKNPSRCGTINYYLCGSDTFITMNEGKAIGAFTMAACAYEQLTRK